MSNSEYCGRRQIACFLMILLAAPLGAMATPPAQQGLSSQQPESVTRSQSQSSQNRPLKSDGDTVRPEQTYPDGPDATRSEAAGRTGQSAAAQPGTEQQQNGTAPPVGTAVAPYEKTTGVAASRPTGAVIAPAKQRRARSIVLRLGIIAGAAVAIGTVTALSAGSHSRP
jgi:hypothetical protein